MFFIYAIITLSCFVVITFLFALTPTAEASALRIRKPIKREEFLDEVRNLAKYCAQANSDNGNGISLRRCKKKILFAYSMLSSRKNKERLLPLHENFLDNFYKIYELVCESDEASKKIRNLPSLDGEPIVFKLCSLIVEKTSGEISKDTILEVASEFNSYRPIKFNEANAFVPSIVIALVCLLSSLASRIVNIEENRKTARLDAKRDRINLNLINSPAYITTLYDNFSEKTRKQLRNLCYDNGLDIETIQENYHLNLTELSSSLNSVLKFKREIDLFVNDEFVLSLCPISAYLSKESSSYRQSDNGTKRLYLERISTEAKKKGKSEFATARNLVQKAQADKIDLACVLFPRPKGKLSQRLFVFCQLFIALALCVGVYFWINSIVSALFVFPIAVIVTQRVFCLLFSSAVKPRILPKKDEKYIDKGKRVNIVCARLVASENEVIDAVNKLKAVALANPDERFCYTLLVDFCSADSEETLFDESLLNAFEREFSFLSDRFCLLVRKRTKNSRGKYEGYEKKRGAILDCFSLAIEGESTPFRKIIGKLPTYEYAIILDSDTLLFNAKQLLCLMEHPYNENTVVASLNMKTLPLSSEKTLFSRLFSGVKGSDAYNQHYCDFVFDAFGEGNFTGKGIVRVKEFYEKTANAFGDERILSHDFIEGAYCGCVNSDEVAYDEYPSTFSSHTARSLRWLRGDFQLLPFIRKKVKNKEKKEVDNPIAPINKWHILYNSILGIVPIVSFVLIFMSVIKNDNRILIFATIPYIIEIVLSPRNIFRQVVLFAFLPVYAVYNFYSITLTIVRLIRRKNLLVWQVFAHFRGGEITPIPCSITVFSLFTLNLFLFNSFFVYGLCLIFVLAIPLENLLSKETMEKEVSVETRNFLTLIATKTWEYFCVSCKEDTNFLPPDNYCERDGIGYAYRTSPTNIGMAIVSAFSAKELGIITLDEAQKFVSNIVNTVQKLEKWNGNLYNWYNLKTLEVLYPRYASSVDSANLIASLYLAFTFASKDDCVKIREIISECKLSAFYDEERNLMRIGYNEVENRFDAHYDLRASEASILYLMATCRGEISPLAIENLSRRTLKYGKSTIASWTGGLFEQLFTPVFFAYPTDSIYFRSCYGMIGAHKKYAQKNGLAFWGISESGYNEINENGDYKYKAFGVREVALSDEGEGKVISPYSVALSLPFDESAVENLYALADNGLVGKFGFYESYDDEPIFSYMAHHQGMLIAGICNYLRNNAINRTLLSLPEFAISQILLADCGKLKGKRKPIFFFPKKIETEVREIRSENLYPTVGLYGRKKYRFTINEWGNGYSLYNDLVVVRKREEGGFFVLVNGESVMNNATAIFAQTGVLYQKKENALVFSLQVAPLLRLSGEKRELKILNESKDSVTLTVSAVADVVLGEHDGDLAHREYSNMFVSSKVLSDGIITQRRGNCACAFTVLGAEKVVYESNRAKFYGRRDGVSNGETLDPVVSASIKITISSGEEKTLSFVLLATENENKASEILELVHSSRYYIRSDEQGALGNMISFDYAGRILSSHSTVKEILSGVNFDLQYPIVVLSLSNERAKSRLISIVNDLKALYKCGIKFHIFVAFSEQSGYFAPLKKSANEIIDESGVRKVLPRGCVVSEVNGERNNELYEFIKENSIDIFADNREVERPYRIITPPFSNAETVAVNRIFRCGENGYLADGSFYIDLSNTVTPKPWSNIISNAKIGTVMTESGGGYTFLTNASQERITVWGNDAVLDEPSEFVLLGEGGKSWSITTSPVRKKAKYYAIHGLGYTEYGCNYNGLASKMTCFIGGTSAKYYIVEIRNAENQTRQINVAYACSLVLGDNKERTKNLISVQKNENSLYAKNLINGLEIYLTSSENASFYSFSCRSIKKTDGNYCINAPSFIDGTDFVYGVTIALPPLGNKKIAFCLQTEENRDFSFVDELLAKEKTRYSNLSAVQISSDAPELDLLYKWLPYQVLCSRFNGRTGFYQSSGAYGFRDQLQDCTALLFVSPKTVREHILRCASRQFIEGDVLHWWHEGGGGVRTSFVDDRLFLPWAVSEYIKFTGEVTLLLEKVSYLKSENIPSGQRTLYKKFEQSNLIESVLNHCLRAIKSVELSANGIPLMKGGDWNDAMDEVGINGKGESVFLAMLLYSVCLDFSRFVVDEQEKTGLIKLAVSLSDAVENYWDGEWYRRAVTDDGTVLGSAQSKECKIDLLTQSFAVLSNACDKKRAFRSLVSAEKMLVDRENGIVKLLSPPFKETDGVGYIAKYPKGIRENGGQYTHCAMWFIKALYEVGESEKAYEIFEMLNPIVKSMDERYGLEPFVVPADIYSGDYIGTGGWSWYTGSAGWAYRVITEDILGIKISKRTLSISPNLPKKIKRLKISVTVMGNKANISVENEGDGEWALYYGKVRYGEPRITVTETTQYHEITLKKEL